jgi:hypothetical protein
MTPDDTPAAIPRTSAEIGSFSVRGTSTSRDPLDLCRQINPLTANITNLIALPPDLLHDGNDASRLAKD